jgi:hypothetical protein
MKTRILAAMFQALAFVVIGLAIIRQKFPASKPTPTVITKP